MSDVETRDDVFWRDVEGRFWPEEKYEGDFAEFEGEWHFGWFSKNGRSPFWFGPFLTESEAIRAAESES